MKKYNHYYLIRKRGHEKIEETELIKGTAPIVYSSYEHNLEAYINEPVMTICKRGNEFYLYEILTGSFITKQKKYKDVIDYLKDDFNRNAIMDAINHKGIYRYTNQLRDYIEENYISCDNLNIHNMIMEVIEI